jgi:integrase
MRAMSISVQVRGGNAQLRVKHRLLPRPFFFTFSDGVDVDARVLEARAYGAQLRALLDRGIVPAELLAKPAPAHDPLLVEVIRAFVKSAPHLTSSDDALLGTMLPELVGVRLSGVTYAWAERYVQRCKRTDNLAPGSIRKRVGALGRVIDWHLRSTESTAGNAVRLLPAGYSQYTEQDRAALAPGAVAKVDVKRDRRLHPGEEARIRPQLGELELLFDVIVNTGMRLREAYRLRVDQVDHAKGVIRVEGTKGARGVLKPRTVPMVRSLRQALKKHCRGRAGLLFPWWSGDPRDLDAVTARLSYLFVKAFTAAGSEGLTEHDLRHEACCRWFEHRTGRGWTFSEIEVCRIMGWTSTAMALRYASLRGEDLAARLG